MNSEFNRNENKDLKNQASEKTPKEAFFQFTKQQLTVNVNKYDKALVSKNSASLFNTQPIDPQKLLEKPVVFTKRLNSMDSDMLEENAYKALDNEDLKLEKRIENIETSLKSTKEKLIVAKTIKDDRAVRELSLQKKTLSRNLENLQLEYKGQNLDTKMTSILAQILNFPKYAKKKINKALRNLFRHSKLIRKYTPIVRSMMVRDTLGRLDKINKSVDELVKMKVPFGEQEARYETLVNHLSRAGALHSQILKELNG